MHTIPKWGQRFSGWMLGAVVALGGGCGEKTAGSSPPTIREVFPLVGSDQGGTEVVISGRGFAGDAVTVSFGPVAATEVSVLGDTLLLVITPSMPVAQSVSLVVSVDGETVSAPEPFLFLVAHELEPPAASGQNDDRAGAQWIAAQGDFWGYLGVEGDTDFYWFDTPRAGIVELTIDFEESFRAFGLSGVNLTVYAEGEAEWYNFVGGAVADALYQNGITQLDQFARSVHPEAGPYAIKITASGSAFGTEWDGFDSDRPYRLSLAYAPGPDLESDQPVSSNVTGAGDTWRDAQPIVFDQGDHGTAWIESYAWYPVDIDWFTFTAAQTGWYRMTLDVTGFDPNTDDAAVLILGDLIVDEPTWAKAGDSYVLAGDPPRCSLGYWELPELQAGQQYYVRLWAAEGAMAGQPYSLRIEYFPGGLEDGEPGDSPPGDTAPSHYDFGVLTSGEEISHQSYAWHNHDRDYAQLHTPVGTTGRLCVTLDLTESYQALGWYDAIENVYGMDMMVYLYDQAWYADPNHPFGDFLTYTHDADNPQQRIEWDAAADADYYVLVRTMDGIDLEHPYTLSVSFWPGATSCPSP